MRDILATDIMQQMLPVLDNSQLQRLQEVLRQILSRYQITGSQAGEEEPTEDDNEAVVDAFIAAKTLEGCSQRTLAYYKSTVNIMLRFVKKNVRHITTEDLRLYLAAIQKNNKVSNTTVDNVRRNLSSFFGWLETENYILKSPVRRIHKVKTAKLVKSTFSDEDLETLRDGCKTKRDLAIIDMLVSTGMRIGELVLLDRDSVNYNERECKVLGKGNKERVVYFDARTKKHLQEYLDGRDDDNPALFVTLDKPHTRVTIGGLEERIRHLGRRLGLQRTHPHKFRRTLATMAIDKGMPVEQVQQVLGHENIDTTMQYAMVKQSNVKTSHRKFLG